jgi:alpha/beta superfamily hydrolase
VADVHDPQARASRWRADLCWVAAATFGSCLVASALGLQQSLTHRLARLETWQADEMSLSLPVPSATAKRVREGNEWIETMRC